MLYNNAFIVRDHQFNRDKDDRKSVFYPYSYVVVSLRLNGISL